MSQTHTDSDNAQDKGPGLRKKCQGQEQWARPKDSPRQEQRERQANEMQDKVADWGGGWE